jgi:hypothetical protein
LLFQQGGYFGQTVNLADRIAEYASGVRRKRLAQPGRHSGRSVIRRRPAAGAIVMFAATTGTDA